MRQLLKFKKIKRETEGKHNQSTKNQKRNKEEQRETKGNRFGYKSVLLCLPEKYPKLKHTKTGFIFEPILAFLCCFSAISLLVFCI